MRLHCTDGSTRREEGGKAGRIEKQKTAEGFSLSVAAKLFSSSPSWDCTLTVELFYQQILDLKIAGISASEVEQAYQSKLL